MEFIITLQLRWKIRVELLEQPVVEYTVGTILPLNLLGIDLVLLKILRQEHIGDIRLLTSNYLIFRIKLASSTLAIKQAFFF